MVRSFGAGLLLAALWSGCGETHTPSDDDQDSDSSDQSDENSDSSDQSDESSDSAEDNAPGDASPDDGTPNDADSEDADAADNQGTDNDAPGDDEGQDVGDSDAAGDDPSDGDAADAADDAQDDTQGDDDTAGDDDTPGDDGLSDGADLLVPAAGALIGQYYGHDSIEQTKDKLGRQLPLHLTYYDFTHDWVSGETEDDLAAGRIPFVNWEVFDTPLDEIIAGKHDEMLATRARAAKALGKKFFIDFGAEMNGEWSPWGGAQNGMGPDKFIEAYRHVHDALAEVDNAVWAWCPNVTDEPSKDWNRAMDYYPGDNYVDWTCVDGYNWGSSGGGGWQSFKEVFENIYPKLAAKNKPIMIGEMASAEVGGDKAAWIAEIIPTLKADYPLIKGLIWFDVDKETDWRISSSPEAETAFKRMVSDPYFNP